MLRIRSLSEPGRYLRKGDLAKELGVTTRTVDRYRDMGMPWFEDFGKVWFDRRAVDAWLQDASARKGAA